MIGMSQTRIDLSAAILGLHAQKRKLEIAIAELQSLNSGMHARRGPKFMGEAERQQVSPTNEALLGAWRQRKAENQHPSHGGEG